VVKETILPSNPGMPGQMLLQGCDRLRHSCAMVELGDKVKVVWHKDADYRPHHPLSFVEGYRSTVNRRRHGRCQLISSSWLTADRHEPLVSFVDPPRDGVTKMTTDRQTHTHMLVRPVGLPKQESH
jgi:hypothetical protein